MFFLSILRTESRCFHQSEPTYLFVLTSVVTGRQCVQFGVLLPVWKQLAHFDTCDMAKWERIEKWQINSLRCFPSLIFIYYWSYSVSTLCLLGLFSLEHTLGLYLSGSAYSSICVFMHVNIVPIYASVTVPCLGPNSTEPGSTNWICAREQKRKRL